MKRLILSLLLLASFTSGFAQVPRITSFTPAAAKPGDVVILTGTGFNATAANNVVFFGATRATVTAASATSVTVTVPTGATYAPITLLNTGSVLACASLSNFNPIYAPAKTNITASDFLPNVDFAMGTNPYSVAIGDLDGDGKPDLAVVNPVSNTVSVLRNTSASGSIAAGSFAPKVDFAAGGGPYSVAIGDLDGDGKPDLAVANADSNTVSVLRNTSASGSITAGSFAPKVDFATGDYPVSVAIGDLDGDGKPDLAVANFYSNTVSVLRNTSASGSITAGSFAPQVDFATGGFSSSVAIGDLDGDGKPDLAVANPSSNNVSVLRNTSASGSITAGSFAPQVDFATGDYPVSVAIGDLDGDGKPDLAVANLYSNTVSVLRNTSVSGSITAGSFAPQVDFATGDYPVSVAIGDLDGDGKPDLAVANQFSSTVSVLRNTSASGSITASSFAPKVDFATGVEPISVAIGDLDRDGKPDLVVANLNSSTVSVLRNADIILPAITSFTPTSGCALTSIVTITGTNFTGATAVSIGGTAATSFTVNSATQITATVGSGTTGIIQVTTSSGTGVSSGNFTVLPVPAAPVAASNSPLAGGSAINLTASAVAGATYSWTGPNGFTSTQQNPVILNATQANSGIYTVVATVNGCASSNASTTVAVGLPSGVSCNPNLNTPLGALSPSGTLLPVITPNVNYSEVITFRNWDNLLVSGITVRVDSLIIDSIINLPCGIGWTTSQTGNKFLNQEYGCIYLNGTTNNAAGQYNLQVSARVKVSFLNWIPITLSNYGFFMAVRVCNAGSNCPAINTALPGLTSTCYTGQINPPVIFTSLGADQSVCTGTALNINPAVQGGTAPYTYNWSSSGSTLSCYTCSSSSITVTSASQVVLVVTDANGLIARDSVAYNAALPPAAPAVGSNSPVTTGGSINLTASAVAGATYSWTGPNGFTSTQQNPIIPNATQANSGTYTVVATVNGCASSGASTAVAVVGGSSGVSCNPNLNTPLGALSPSGTLLPVITPNVNYSEAITFRNWDSLTIYGFRYRIEDLVIEDISNLPCGIGWATSQTGNKFLNQEFGCLYLNGTTNDTAGQYNLQVSVRVFINSIPIPYTGTLSSLGIFMAVRVCNTGGNCPAIDTALTGLTATCNTGQVNPPVILTVNLGADQSVCTGTALNINPAVQGGTAPYTYNWSSSGSPLSCYTCSSSSITVTSASQVVLVVTDANGLIARDSVAYNAALPPAAPAVGSNSPVTAGGSINLTASAVAGATYSWTGPNGFTSTQQNPIIPNATQANSGIYTVVATVNGCASSNASTTVAVGLPSGVSCNPNLNTPLGALSPSGTLLPVITPNVNYSEVITFRNWDSVTVSGLRVRVDYLIIDSIINLPCGIGWATSQTDNKFLNQEYGCIYLNGTTNDAAGQYNLKVKVKVKVSLLPNPVPYELSSLGIFMAVRVCNTGGNCPAIDTALPGLTTTCNTGQVTPPVSFTVNLGADQSVCTGTALNINPAVQGGTAPYTYNWSSSGSPLSCYTCSSSSITVTSASQVVLVVTDANGLIARDSIAYNIAQAPATPNIIGNTNITPQTPYNYSVSSVGGVQYTWIAQNGSIQSGQGTNSVSVVWSNNGPYTLQLTLSIAANCSSSAYLTVTNGGGCNIPVNVTTVSSNPICTGDTILLIASAAAGTSYQWLKNGNNITGATNDTLKVTATGTYQVQVSNGICAIVSSGYIFTFEPSPITPVILGNSSVTGCSQQPVNLTLNGTYPNYLWSNGATTASITVTASGNYSVTVTATNGCRANSAPVAINQSVAAAPAICVVSVDSALNANVVVWEKLNTAAVDSYYIYKETNQFNVFNKIGSKGVNEFSTFIDLASTPAQQADRYRIAILDTCGNLTVQSDAHKTIHLTINQGLGGVWNLIWNGYEGFSFSSYNIYRGTSSGSLVQIGSISSGNTSYTDIAPPANTLYYQVEAENPAGCNPTAKQAGYSSSVSNIVSTNPNGITEMDNTLKIAVYPNPTQGNILLDIQATYQRTAVVHIMDVVGTEVMKEHLILTAGKNTVEMGLGQFANGLYLLRVLDENGNSLGSYKIVKH